MPDSSHGGFATTQWTVIARAGGDPDQRRGALGELCGRYWYPLYAFLRRDGHDPDAAADHVQSFFADLLARDAIAAADPTRGRFRTFLLTACRNHVRNRVRHDRAVSRGGRAVTLSFSIDSGEDRYAREPVVHDDPQRLFQRRWALEVIDAAVSGLAEEMRRAGRGERFEALRPLIAPTPDPPSHAEVAKQLGIKEGNVKVAVHRLRKKLAEYLRAEVAATVDGDQPTAIDDEVGELLNALSM